MFQIAVKLPVHPSCDVSCKFEVQKPDRTQVRGMQWATSCMCAVLLSWLPQPCWRGATPHSLLETLILKTGSGQPSTQPVPFFLLVLPALVLKPKQAIKGPRTIILWNLCKGKGVRTGAAVRLVLSYNWCGCATLNCRTMTEFIKVSFCKW